MKRFAYRIRVLTSLRIGSGIPSATADDTLVRDGAGEPVIPASTVKGAARVGAAGVLPPDRVGAAFGRADDAAGTVAFRDAAAPAGLQPVVDEVTTVTLTPGRTARPGGLTTNEVLRPLAYGRDGQLHPLLLEGTVTAAGTGDDRDLAAALRGLATITSLGARTRRGMGQVRVALPPSVESLLSELELS